MPKLKKGRTMTEVLYVYVTPANVQHAKTKGKQVHGSASAYVNALIEKDRRSKAAVEGSRKAA